MIPKVGVFKQQYFLAHESVFGQSSVGDSSSPLYSEATEEPGKLEAASSAGSLLTCVLVDAGCQLGPPLGLRLEYMLIDLHAAGLQGWASQTDQGAVVMPITQPQKPHSVPCAIVTSAHIFKGREKRACLSMGEYQHHIVKRGMKNTNAAIFKKCTCHKIPNRQNESVVLEGYWLP